MTHNQYLHCLHLCRLHQADQPCSQSARSEDEHVKVGGWEHTPVCEHAQGYSLPLVLGHVEGHFISLVDFTLIIHVCECIRHKEVLLQGRGRPGGWLVVDRQADRCMTMHLLQFFHK